MYRTAFFLQNTFELNHAGRKGSAVFIKGVTEAKIESNTFKNNKAVDVLQEREMIPAYAKYFLEVDQTDMSNYRPFNLAIPTNEVNKCG